MDFERGTIINAGNAVFGATQTGVGTALDFVGLGSLACGSEATPASSSAPVNRAAFEKASVTRMLDECEQHTPRKWSYHQPRRDASAPSTPLDVLRNEFEVLSQRLRAAEGLMSGEGTASRGTPSGGSQKSPFPVHTGEDSSRHLNRFLGRSTSERTVQYSSAGTAQSTNTENSDDDDSVPATASPRKALLPIPPVGPDVPEPLATADDDDELIYVPPPEEPEPGPEPRHGQIVSLLQDVEARLSLRLNGIESTVQRLLRDEREVTPQESLDYIIPLEREDISQVEQPRRHRRRRDQEKRWARAVLESFAPEALPDAANAPSARSHATV